MFRKKKSNVELPTGPINYPSGLAVVTDDGVFLIKNSSKYKFFSERTFKSWNMSTVKGTKESLSKFNYSGVLGFRDGTLINNIADGKIYLISNNKLRHITNPDVFTRYGLKDLVRASNREVEIHDVGEDLE